MTMSEFESLIWMPLLKSVDATEEHKASCPFDEHRILRGVASCEEPDLQREVVIQKGIDLMPCIERGYINYDHKGSPIGIPLNLSLVNAEGHPLIAKSGAPMKGTVLYAEAELWPTSAGHRGADEAWATAQCANATGRPFGYSIEGKVLQRNGNRIVKSELRHLALTHQPVQQRSFAIAELVKSMGTEGMTPVLLENLNGKITSILWGDASCGHFNHKGEFSKGRFGALEHLTKCKGEVPEDAMNFLKYLITSGIAR